MLCPHCGKELPEGVKVCENCGQSVAAQPTPAPEPEVYQPEPAPAADPDQAELIRNLSECWRGSRSFNGLVIPIWVLVGTWGLFIAIYFLEGDWFTGLFLLLYSVPFLILAIVFTSTKGKKTKEMFAIARQLGVSPNMADIRRFLEAHKQAMIAAEPKQTKLIRDLRGCWKRRKRFKITAISLWPAACIFGLLCYALWGARRNPHIGILPYYFMLCVLLCLITAIVFTVMKFKKSKEMFAIARQLGVSPNKADIREFIEAHKQVKDAAKAAAEPNQADPVRNLRGCWKGRKIFNIVAISMWVLADLWGIFVITIYFLVGWYPGLLYLLFYFVTFLILGFVFTSKKGKKTEEMFAIARQLGVSPDLRSVKEYLEHQKR